MSKKHHSSSNHHFRSTSLVRHIPQHVWILIEVLTTLVVLHYAHIPICEFLQVLKELTG